MEIGRGKKIIVRKLLREDVDKMQNWARHEDPLFFHYNFPKMNKRERDEWYQIKTMKFKKKSFTIENIEGMVVGYLSIRNIKWIKRESELGIVLDAKYMNQGYGTEAIKIFLDYYFSEMKMNTIILRAAKFNKRAIKCYEHCGFEIIAEQQDEFEDQDAEIFDNPLYRELDKLFTAAKGKKMTQYLHMELKKEVFYNKINSLSTKIMA